MATRKPAKLTLDEVRRLVDAQAAARKKLRDEAIARSRARTRAMTHDDWYDTGAITRYAKGAVTDVEPAQRQTAAVTNAYHARLLTRMTGKTVAPARQVGITRLRGIPHDSVYGRVADGYRYDISQGHTRAEAADLAVQRATELAEMDVALASRAQSRQVTSTKKQVLYYRRVIRPELSKSGASCGLCIVASHRTYNKADLMPIHFRCNCEVVPVVDRNTDYGLDVNDEDLAEVYAAAGGNTAKKLKETRFTIHQHGELGPVLTYRGNRFRGPSQVTEDTDGDKPVPLE